MKKTFALALIFCTLSCFAEDIKDTWFDMFAKAAEAKKAIVKGIKASPDAEYIKKTEMLIIYNYITTDCKIFSVVISKKDL